MEWFKKLKTWQKVLLILFVIIVLGKVFGGKKEAVATSTKADDEIAAMVDSAAAVVDKKNEEIKKQGNWSYSEEVDKMSNKTNYFASISSNSPVDLKFPYNKGSYGAFTVRRMEGKLGAVLTVSGSQFSNADVYGGTVTIKFDEEAGRKYSYGKASDGSSDVIFIENTKLLISKLKTAKTMLIEAEFYNNGSKIMEFDVKSFEWNH